MSVFAITGNLASGKSVVLNLLRKKGARTFHVDKKIHSYYRNRKGIVFRKIIALFPQAVTKGVIDRKKLAALIFSDKDKLQKLEAVVHPPAIAELLAWVRESRSRNKIAAAEVPLLFEKNLQGSFDGIIVVKVKKSILLKRINKKYSLSGSAAYRRLSLMVPQAEKIKQADFIVENNGSLKELKKEVDFLWRKIKQR